MRDPVESRDFDVVILGAGFAGICQARHLLLNLPGVRVALVNPGPGDSASRDLPVSESLSEIGALFVNKELGLHDYMIERHAPKQGLSFHWPRRYEETGSLEDYFHVWVNRESDISNFHVNLRTFERDVLAMTRELGAEYFQGKVTDIELPPGDASNVVALRGSDGEDWVLKAKHLVDAGGRRFILGERRDNLLSGPENLRGLDNGCSWLRVRDADRAVFHDGLGGHETSTSRYYATNCWFGLGHWVWQTPSFGDGMELSVGTVYHRDVIDAESLDSSAKLLTFLEKNHNLLYRLVRTGKVIDFGCCPRVAHRSKELFSVDNHYVIGHAASFFDALYAHDTSAIALGVESVTELVRMKLDGDPHAESKRKLFNDFALALADEANLLAARLRQLGHASAMSWRIFFDYMWRFGLHVPMYVGKWHLDRGFLETYLRNASPSYLPGGLFESVQDTLDAVVDRNLNIGLMDVSRSDQLGSYTALHHVDEFRYRIETEPLRCNVFLEWRRLALFLTWWYGRLQWKVHGVRALAPRRLRHWLGLLAMALVAGRNELKHRLRTFGEPTNSVLARNIEESFAYQRQSVLQPWGTGRRSPEQRPRSSDAAGPVGLSARSSS